jgi:hypothetical protein
MHLQRNTTNTTSTLDRVLGYSLAALSMFVVGYTATRVYLDRPLENNTASQSTVIPHEAALWSALGR